MTAPITPPPTDTDALRALEQAIPPAPWRVAQSLPFPGIRTPAGWEVVYASYADTAKVLEFIAAMRNAMPALLTELEQLRAEVGRAIRELNKLRAHECVPTQDAYDKACAALWRHRERADAAERDRDAARADADQLRAELDTMTAVAASNRRHVEYMAQELERVVKAVRFVHAESDGRCVTCTEHCDCLDSDPNAKVGDCTHGNAEWPCTTIRTMGDPLGTAAGVAVQAGQPADLFAVDPDQPNDFDPVTGRLVQVVYPGAVAGTGQQDTATDMRCGKRGPDGAVCVRTVGHEHAGRSHRGVDADGEERTWHSQRHTAAVTPAADKADGSKA